VVLPLLLAGVLTGCQGNGSTAKVVPEKPAAASEPAATDTPVKPVEVEVTVLTPKIAVEKPVLDLGEIGTDTRNKGKFEFVNTGKAPLKILQVFSCCGVTTKGVEKGQEYAPGDGGALEFEFITGSTTLPGATRELRLQTNDPDKPIVSLTIKAVIVRRVESGPKKLRLFLRRENAGCENVTLRSLDGKPFSIVSLRSTANALSGEFDPNTQATEFSIKLHADMEKLARNVRGVISIDLTHPECGNIRVPFDVLPEFTINPAYIVVWDLKSGQTLERDIQVRGNYQNDFEIESVSSQKGMVTLLDKKKVDDHYELRIQIKTPERTDNAAMTTDVVEVKIKGGETVSIPFRGVYVEG
jgi:hypothetical protein